MSKNILKNTLTNKAHWIVNKALAKEIGLEQSLVLQHFIDLQFNIFDGKEFFQQIKRIEKELPLTRYSIKKSISELEELNLITVNKKGLPAKNYYKVKVDNIVKIINTDHRPTSAGENDKVDEGDGQCVENATTSAHENDKLVNANSTDQEKKQVKKDLEDKRKEDVEDLLKEDLEDTSNTSAENSFKKNVFEEEINFKKGSDVDNAIQSLRNHFGDEYDKLNRKYN